jgi:hypothetical protein
MSYFDDELIKELKAHNIPFNILSVNNHNSIVREINERIPFSGSKIAWSKLKKSISFEDELPHAANSQLAKEIKNVATDEIVILGDSVCDEAYIIHSEDLEEALRFFSEIPQHTYITSTSLEWIACISFEGQWNFANLVSE